jgi:hypoxanthine phosphoribosyltransferase
VAESDSQLPPVLIAEPEIAARVAALAGEIDRDSAGMDELVLVAVLRGAFIFAADLARRLRTPCRVDFVALASYQGAVAPGAVRLLMDLRTDIAGRHVLIVEDIVDSGRTLAYLMALLRTRRPASLRSCALTRKPDRQDVDVPVDYVGFDIPDRWVVGYGLDYRDQWRTLPYIGVVDAERITPPAPGAATPPSLPPLPRSDPRRSNR